MDVSMPSTVVLIVCKTLLVGTPDANDGYTGHENRDWAYEGSMMLCHREEVAMYNSDPAAQFTAASCMASAIKLGTDWDVQHTGTANPYRTWRVACPVPMFSDLTGNGPSPDDPVVGYVLPDCGHRDTVICETDSVI